jgi:hypothetical protein
MRWSSAFTHAAFSSKSKSSQNLVIAEYSQGFLLDIPDLLFFRLLADILRIVSPVSSGDSRPSARMSAQFPAR